MKKLYMKKISLGAVFLALGIVLPFLTAQLKQLGSMLLPMHIPIMLAGLVCGGPVGCMIGFICPLLRSFLFGMPYLYPNAIAMAFELAVYGGVSGFVYSNRTNKNTLSVFIGIIPAMLAGRAVFGIAKALLLMLSQNNSYSFTAFVMSAFVNSFPGIVLQLILVPVVMSYINKFRKF